jgi:hypothetical protein
MAQIRTQRLVAGCLLTLLAVAVYLPAIGNDFHYDDFHSIVNNPHIRSLDHVGDFFVDPSLFSENPESAMYRPVLLTSYALNYLVGELDPAGFHASNIVLHAANVALLYGLLLALGMPLGQAAASGLLFAVTPLNAEAVNYVSSRSELLMASLLLTSCVCYVRASRRRGHYRVWFAAAMLAGTLAILTKSVGVITVPMWVLCDWLAVGSWRLLWTQRRLHYLAMLCVDALYLAYSRGIVGKALLGPVRDFDVQLWTQAKAWVYYLTKLPFPVHLSVEPQFAISRSLADGPVIVAALLLLSLVLLVCARDSRARAGKSSSPARVLTAIPDAGSWARFGVVWSAISLLPAAVVPLIALVNEHRCYLASAGAAIVIVGVAAPMFSRRLLSVVTLGARVVIAISLTLTRGEVWNDEISLWRDATLEGPLMVKPHVRLAAALGEIGGC